MPPIALNATPFRNYPPTPATPCCLGRETTTRSLKARKHFSTQLCGKLSILRNKNYSSKYELTNGLTTSLNVKSVCAHLGATAWYSTKFTLLATAFRETSLILSSDIVLTRVSLRCVCKTNSPSTNTVISATQDSSFPLLGPRFRVVQAFSLKSRRTRVERRTTD